jgi:rare lipoprotein A
MIKIFLTVILVVVCFTSFDVINTSYPSEIRFIGQWKYIYEVGIASWYGHFHHGMIMANGKPFDMYALSIAHKTLPFGTKVRITNLENGKQIDLIVTDRGPYYKTRIVDLSFAAAAKIGMVDAGVIPCKLEIIRGMVG